MIACKTSYWPQSCIYSLFKSLYLKCKYYLFFVCIVVTRVMGFYSKIVQVGFYARKSLSIISLNFMTRWKYSFIYACCLYKYLIGMLYKQNYSDSCLLKHFKYFFILYRFLLCFMLLFQNLIGDNIKIF